MTWFSRLPDSAKSTIGALGALALAFSVGGSFALALSGYKAIPETVADHEARIVRMETDNRDQVQSINAKLDLLVRYRCAELPPSQRLFQPICDEVQ